MWSAIALHGAFQKLQCCLAIPPLRRENLKNLTFVIDGPPKIMCFAIDFDEYLV